VSAGGCEIIPGTPKPAKQRQPIQSTERVSKKNATGATTQCCQHNHTLSASWFRGAVQTSCKPHCKTGCSRGRAIHCAVKTPESANIPPLPSFNYLQTFWPSRPRLTPCRGYIRSSRALGCQARIVSTSATYAERVETPKSLVWRSLANLPLTVLENEKL